MPRKILFDTDPGIDDAMALLFAFASPELEVTGVTSIFGNVYTEQGTQNALRLVEFAGYPDIPVAHGADLPLSTPFDEPAWFVHGKDGLGDTNQPPPRGRPIAISAAQFIAETIMQNPGEITLVPVGPLTNIALAYKLEPRIAENVAEVVIMGGAATVNGNVNPAAEANIWHDPHAADIVFTAGWPLTMLGLDVTMKVLMPDAYLTEIRDTGGRFASYIYDISRHYLNFHREAHDGLNGLHTHDPSTIAYLLDPTLFTIEQGPIRVITEGIAMGYTLWDRQVEWFLENEWSIQKPVNVCVDVDAARFLALYRERIVQAG